MYNRVAHSHIARQLGTRSKMPLDGTVVFPPGPDGNNLVRFVAESVLGILAIHHVSDSVVDLTSVAKRLVLNKDDLHLDCMFGISLVIRLRH